MRAFLETYDVDTGEIDQVLATEHLIEAPNWTRDGGALIVNANGKLFRVALDAPHLEHIDTGGFARLNNDHGLSPDGTRLAISDKTETGKSCIYTLPVTGGTPQRITDHVPSWWHGWSPDGQNLTYTCVRQEQFGIAICPANGGAETVLIRSAHHYDGPDYSHDGAWIWFNSDRGGIMSLWRMRNDGSDVQQMTFGDSVDWFAHPSPDGCHVCYLAYPPRTTGHPFGRDVELRLMPAIGGESRCLTAFYGGQGTLNVPNWAPDGRRFAYVRYARPT